MRRYHTTLTDRDWQPVLVDVSCTGDQWQLVMRRRLPDGLSEFKGPGFNMLGSPVVHPLTDVLGDLTSEQTDELAQICALFVDWGVRLDTERLCRVYVTLFA